MNRIHNLDYLRGMAAVSIMLYHFNLFVHGPFTSETVLGRLGVYGVSVFYILSGLTLYLVYVNSMGPSKEDILSFGMKRVFRIFPLLWLALAANLSLKQDLPDIKGLFLNASGLFGFVKPTVYFSPGMWSIGNELVFYAFFPFFIYLIKRKTQWFMPVVLMLFLVYLYFAYFRLSPLETLETQWAVYINPLNQVFLFTSGVLMGYKLKNIQIGNRMLAGLLVIALLVFVLYPAYGDLINLVTGWNRVLFTALMFVVCFCFFSISYRLPGFLHNSLQVLGESSYSIYLMHPIIWTTMELILNRAGIALNIYAKFGLAISLSIGLSYLIYFYFEKYFISLGKIVTLRFKPSRKSQLVNPGL